MREGIKYYYCGAYLKAQAQPTPNAALRGSFFIQIISFSLFLSTDVTAQRCCGVCVYSFLLMLFAFSSLLPTFLSSPFFFWM
jgi:hypothetical protein